MKPFGYSYLVDLYDCRDGVASNMELHYRFLERLVEKLEMVPMNLPIVVNVPTKNGVDLFPDKSGCSAWVALITSGIQIHSVEPKRFITIDCYSCNEFDYNMVREFAMETFGAKTFEDHYVVRGTKYGD